jgi:hypothetical protein
MDFNFVMALPLVLGAIFLSGCSSEKTSEPPTEEAPLLVAYWPLDDTAGQAMRDETGHGHDGKLIGTASLSEGVSGKAVLIQGNGHGIDVADDSAFGFRGGFTLGLSFKISAFPPGQGFLFFRGDARSGMDSYLLSIHSADSSLRFTIVGSPDGSAGDSAVSVSAPVASGQWYRVDAVFDTTGGNTVALYLNGSLASKKPTSILPLARLEAGQNAGIGIGHHAGRTGGDYAFNGLIDEVRVYSGALPSGKIGSGEY